MPEQEFLVGIDLALDPYFKKVMGGFLQANLAKEPTYSIFHQGLHNMLRIRGRVPDFVCLGISVRNTELCQDGNIGKETNACEMIQPRQLVLDRCPYNNYEEIMVVIAKCLIMAGISFGCHNLHWRQDYSARNVQAL
jgi:hypothetical protein